ncbi:RDD family protein [Neisseria animalis]|uniref:RDD family protein n=1 Tax=Neisseria animalis TaxID=492 RepID=A0A5P3MVV2_NEIAN|nr:RDD family protein [Neisseria animalis]QEY24891.1 RDD family protein [Neisseria animalis]ROW32525.1 RDD family protein [Neisseria animalis]VEE08243.1 Membrane protein [Neisseria animalis]
MTPFPPASLKRRFAAMLYELLLVGAVTALAALLSGIVAIVLNPVSTYLSTLVTCLLVLAFWWYYFRANWLLKGQTLAMQTWKIGLANEYGVHPPLYQLRLRFIWACIFIVFIPLLAYAALRHLLGIPPMTAFPAALIWLILPWGFALLNPDRQFLYDFLAGTRLVDLKVSAK